MTLTLRSLLAAAIVLLLGSAISPAVQAQVPLANPSFEQPVLSDNQLVNPLPAGFGWSVRGSAALVNGLIAGVEPAMGRQWLQMSSGAVISQAVSLQPGTYYVTLHAMSTGVAGQTVKVSMDATSVPVLTPDSTLSQQIFAGFTISVAGTYTLKIELPDPPVGSTQAGILAIDNIVLNKQGTNTAPSVAIASPVAGRPYSDVYLNVVATAIDPDGSISKVEFYDGATLLGTVTTAPYVLQLTATGVGTKSLTAKAYDNLNVTSTSDVVVFTYNGGTAKPFVMNGGFEYPRLAPATVNGTGSVYPWNFSSYSSYQASTGAPAQGWSNLNVGALSGRQSMFVDGRYPGAVVQQNVTLPAGSYGVSFDATTQYVQGWQVLWNGLYVGDGSYPAGSFAFPFSASGGVGTLTFQTTGSYIYGAIMALDNVRVGPAGPPIVGFSTASSGNTFTAPAAIRFLATAEAYDRKITQTQFLNGSVVLGTIGGANSTFDWVNVAPGSYTVYAKVTDSTGAVTTSSPVSLTVNAPTTAAFFNPGFEYASAFAALGGLPGRGWDGPTLSACTWCAFISGKGSGFLPEATVLPEGSSAALINGSGWISQNVYMPAGSYKVGFKAAQVGGSGQAIRVIINGTALETFTPGASFASYQTSQFTIVSGGVQVVRFESATPSVTTYVAMDDLTILPQNTPQPAPVITTAFSTPFIQSGSGATTLSVTVTNVSSTALANVAFVINPYPNGLTNSASPFPTISGAQCTGSLAASPNGTSISLSGGSIAANSSCTFSVQLLGTTPGSYSISTGPVTATNTNTASGATTGSLLVMAGPTIAKSFGTGSLGAGQSVALVLTITNPSTNPQAVTGISVLDMFPTVPGPMTLANTTIGTRLNGVANACATVTKADGISAIAAGDTSALVKISSLAAGSACEVQLNITATAAGTYTNTTGSISATGPGALTGASASSSITVKQAQTISFGAAPTPTYGQGTFTVSASASSGLPVAYSSLTAAVCTVNATSGVVAIVTAGPCTIAADQAGNATYGAAPQATQTITIAKVNQTITFGAQTASRSYSTTPFAISPLATASSGLAVAYTSATTAVCTVTGTNVTSLGVGTCTINANQSGDTNFNSATQVAQSFTITQANQTITFGAQSTPRSFVANGTFGLAPLATSSAGLSVSYSSTTSAICTIAATTVTMLSAGTCTIAANQAGNANYSPALQQTQSIVLSAGAVGSLTFASQPAAVAYGGYVGLNANFVGSSPAVAVTYTNLATGLSVGSGCVPGTPCAWAPPSSGAHTIQASVTLQNGEIKTTSATFVASATPNALASNAAIDTITRSVGTTPGAFTVSDSGAATYSIPIQVAPGTAGVQPNLAFSYSSQGGNGHLGVGWSISGLSSVTRCPKTYGQDDVKQPISYQSPASDAYCLDGQRLIPVSTSSSMRMVWDCDLAFETRSSRLVQQTEYRTETDSYSRIISYNESPTCIAGPSRFEVYTKSGQILNYGSRYWVVANGYAFNFKSPDRGNTAFVWALDQVQDTVGNRMYIDYDATKVWILPIMRNGSVCSASDVSGGLCQTWDVCLKANFDAGQCLQAPTVVYLGAGAPDTGNFSALALPALGALPGVEYYPTRIAYTFNPAVNTATTQAAQAVLFNYGERGNINGQDCGDCSVSFDAGSGQHMMSKYLSSVETRAGGVYDSTPAANNGNTAYSGGSVVRKYNLQYDFSTTTNRVRLKAIREEGSDGVSLPLTSFSWTSPGLGVTKAAFAGGRTDLADSSNSTHAKIGDIDGDGISDLIQLTGNGTSQTYARYTLGANGHSTSQQSLLVAPQGNSFNYADSNIYWDIGDFNGDGKVDIVFRTSVNTSTGSDWGVFFAKPGQSTWTAVMQTTTGQPIRSAGDAKPSFRGDFNGDGRIDFAFYDGAQPNGRERWRMYFGADNDSIIGPVYVEHDPALIDNSELEARVVIGDFTGDGRADFAFRPPNSNYSGNRAWKFCASTLPITPVAGSTYNLNCTATNVMAGPGNVERSTVVDMNGDGIADMVAPTFGNLSCEGAGPQVSGTRCWSVCLSTADGGFSCWDQLGPATKATLSYFTDANGVYQATEASLLAAHEKAIKQTIFGDFNGDGRTDYAAQLDANRWTVCYSRGANLPAKAAYALESNYLPRFDCRIVSADANAGSATWPIPSSSDPQIGVDYLVGDFAGKGRTSLLSRLTNKDFQLLQMAGDFPDMMNLVTTGLGATTGITYKPLTDSTVYTKGTTALAYPTFNMQSPLYVVSRVEASTAGSIFATDYQYEALVGAVDSNTGTDASGRGRGLLGFGKRRTTDSNGIVTEIESSQVWPIAGRPTKITKWAPGGGVNRKVNEVVNTWETRATARTTTSASRTVYSYEVFLTSSVEKSWELNGHDGVDGTLLHTVTTTTPLVQFDSYGNPLYISVATTDGYTKETTNTYSNDSTQWLLGRLKKSTVRSTLPDLTVTDRNADFDYFCIDGFSCPANGRMKGLLATEYVEKSATASDLSLTTSYTYDSFGNRATTSTSFFEKDALGNLVSKGRSATTTWTSDGRFPQTQTNALNQQEVRTFDTRWGVPTGINHIDGMRTALSYDGFGRKIGEQRYDAFVGGNLVAQTSWTYAAETAPGEKYSIKLKKHDGSIATSYFDELQREVRTTTNTFSGSADATARTGYDSLGRKVWSMRPQAGATGSSTIAGTVVDYDVLNRPVQETILNAGVDPNLWRSTRTPTDIFSTTVTTYSRTSAPDPGYGTTARNRSVVTVTRSNIAANGGNQATSREANSQGQTVRVLDANSKDTWYKYDPMGNLEKVTVPINGATNTFVENMRYDRRGRKIAMWNADVSTANTQAGGWTYEYNGAGELTKQTDANGTVTIMVYDTLGRITNRSESSNSAGVSSFSTAWSYDNAPECGGTQASRVGKLCRVTTGNGGVSLGAAKTVTYDNQGRPFQVLTKTNGKDYYTYTTYDANGRVDLTGYPADDVGRPLWVKTEYNPRGFVDKIRDPAFGSSTIYWQALSRYDDGQPYQVNVGNVLVSKNYDTVGRIQTIGASNNGGSSNNLQASTYTFDQIGNLVSRADSLATPNESYVYDLLNRLKTGPAGTYVYDDGGNLTTKPGAGTLTYLTGGHRLTLAGYSYDNNGNITSKPVSGGSLSVNQYTPFNLPLSISGVAATSLAYDYDGDRARVKEDSTVAGVTTSTVYIGSQFYEEITKAGVKSYRYYIGSPDGVIAVTNVGTGGAGTGRPEKYWLKDHLGSLYAEMNYDGSGLQRVSFDAWGAASTGDFAGFSTQRGFTGHEHLTEIGIVHMNGRLYDPFTGRMLQADPIIQDPYNPQNFNRYSYVMNNPLSFTDPSGFSWWTKWRRPIVATVAAIVTYGAASWAMTSSVLQSGTSSMFATYGYEAGATLTSFGQATAAAAAGFASGGIAGGNLQSAVQGAFSAGVTAGVNIGFADASFPSQFAAKVTASAALAHVQGGDWRRAAYFAAFVELGRAGWEYTNSETNKLYSGSCRTHQNCAFDDNGYTTDGGRNIKAGFAEGELERAPGAITYYLDSGMGMEGKGHLYSPESAFCRAVSGPVCAAIRGFVRQVSKPHDWGNSWAYDKEPLSSSFGDRLQGGGLSSFGARIAYEAGVQTWSLATMIPMATFTGFSLYGGYFNPQVYGKRR